MSATKNKIENQNLLNKYEETRTVIYTGWIATISGLTNFNSLINFFKIKNSLKVNVIMIPIRWDEALKYVFYSVNGAKWLENNVWAILACVFLIMCLLYLYRIPPEDVDELRLEPDLYVEEHVHISFFIKIMSFVIIILTCFFAWYGYLIQTAIIHLILTFASVIFTYRNDSMYYFVEDSLYPQRAFDYGNSPGFISRFKRIFLRVAKSFFVFRFLIVHFFFMTPLGLAMWVTNTLYIIITLPIPGAIIDANNVYIWYTVAFICINSALYAIWFIFFVDHYKKK